MTNPEFQVCSDCSFENLLDAKFCQQCGYQFVIICPKCSETIDPDARFCKNCGAEIEIAKNHQKEASLQELRQTAPKGLQEKVRLAISQIDDERKPVTILFVDLVGSTSKAEKMDPEEWKEVVTGAHRRLSEAIYRYEGTVAQLLGDGLLAFFGAPITHEDDPSRAVHAGLAIQESIKEYAQELAGYVDDFHVRVGINTGTVIMGDIGEGLHVEYLAVGDAVNVASRVESAARPDSVWLGEDCARLVISEFELKDQGEIQVKGKAESLRLYEVVGRISEKESHRKAKYKASIFVGRESEKQQLQAALLDLCKGHGQIVTIIGEAGIGKSRLVEELRSFAARYDEINESDRDEILLVKPASLRWLEGCSLSYGSSLSFWAITKLLLADLGLKEGAPEARVDLALRKRTKDLFAKDARKVLPFLVNLLGLRLEGDSEDLIQSLDGESLRRETLSAIYEYFFRLAEEKPTVLIFEDLHWADPSSIKALEVLLPLADRTPLMILCPMRIERDHASWGIHLLAETNYAHRYTKVSPQKLSNIESDQLVDGLIGMSDLPERVHHFVMKRSEGNPLYLEEVIKHLVEGEYMVEGRDTWLMTMDIGEIGVPDTLQGLLLARIDRLEEDVRRTLQLASVIGRSFMYRLLEAISGVERELDDQLSQLQRADLVRENARLPELEYIFKHSLTQEAAYNSLLVERRKEFHQKVGEVIEMQFQERAEEFTGLLAHHWERAGRPEKAIQYLLRAGARARRLHANLEALGYYNRAVDLMYDDSDSYLPTLMHRAHVLLELFRGKEAVADFEKLQSIAHRNNDRQSELIILLGLGRGNYILSLDETDIEFAQRSRNFYESAYELAKDIGDQAGMIKALVPTTWYKDFWPEYADQARQNAEKASNLSLELGDEDLIFDSKLALAHTGTLFERERLGAELLDQLEVRKDYSRLNILLFRLMFTNLSLGNFTKAVQTCEAGFKIARKIGVPPVQYATIRALAYIQLGRFDDARHSLEEEVADEAHRFGKAFRDTGYGIYYFEMLSYKKARETLESSIKQADLVGRAWLVNSGRFYLARALVEGRVGSNSEIKNILRYFDSSESPDDALIFGHLALSNDDFTQALEMANKLVTHSEESGRRPDMASALLLKAQTLMAMEQIEEAVVAAEEGVQLAVEMDYLPVLWRLRGTKAEALKRLGRQKESANEFKGASDSIEELAGNISEEDLRSAFLSNTIVSSILAAAITKSEEIS